MKKFTLFAALTASAITLWAAPPSGYYSPLDGISQPAELKTAVYTVINPHTVPTVADMERYYYNSLPVFFQRTDTYPESNQWWDMYSDIPFYAPSMKGLNREHSFPKSWWGGNTDIPPFVDLNHLYPSEAAANQAKSNYPLGEVNRSEKVSFDNGVSTVGYAVNGQGGNAPRVFEPADEYKGDFARTYFYMVTCYQNLTWAQKYSWMLQTGTYPTLKQWAVDLLLRWSREDPVSQKEIDRNEQVYDIQNNRNPFIDLPGLEQYIWGDKMGQKFTVPGGSGGGGGTTEPQLFSPVADMSLDFNQVAEGGSTRSLLLFRGENLKGNVSVVVTGTDRRMFGIDERSISTSLINSADGYYLPVYYKPTAQGRHTANLTVFDVDGWPAGKSLNVTLIGECVAAPALSQIKALPATDITSDSYTANWEEPSEVVDYYVVNRSHYVDGKVVVEEILAEDNSVTITGFREGDYDSYTVQSVRLGFRSTPSNAIVVSRGGLQGIDAGTPMAVEVYENTVRFICASTLRNVALYDATGRLVMRLDTVSRNDEFTLPRGIYIITADGVTVPARILVK